MPFEGMLFDSLRAVCALCIELQYYFGPHSFHITKIFLALWPVFLHIALTFCVHFQD